MGTPAYLAGSPVPPNPYGIPFFFFDAQGNPTGIDPAGFPVRRALANFLLAYDSNMKPIVGQQVTLTEDNGVAAAARIDLLEARAAAGDCDLVVKGRIHGREAGFVWDNGTFISDDSRQAPLSDAALRALVGERAESLTFTAVPLDSGWRIGVDRDGDGDLDGDERGDDDHGHHDGP